MTGLTYHGLPVEFLGMHRKPMGSHRRHGYGGFPGYVTIRDGAGVVKTIRADLVQVVTR